MFIIILILIILLFNKYLSSILYKKKIGFTSLKIQETETQFSLYYRIKRLSSLPKFTKQLSDRVGLWTLVSNPRVYFQNHLSITRGICKITEGNICSVKMWVILWFPKNYISSYNMFTYLKQNYSPSLLKGK